MVSLPQEIQDDYQLCLQRPVEYREKVESISDLFGQQGNNRFKSDNCAVYVVGRFQCAPVVMFGVNPGYSPKNNSAEELEARKSWQNYQNLYYDFFRFFALNKFESPYYTALWYLLSGITETNFPKQRKWDLFDKYLCNIELIPYHSQGISLPSILTTLQFEYLKNRYNSNIEFIISYNPKLFIFNGKIWKTLLIGLDLIKEYTKVPVTPNFNIYFFELYGVPSVIFDRFFQRHFWGITNHDRLVTIPRLIHGKFEYLSNDLSIISNRN